jgi:hypothetical protein
MRRRPAFDLRLKRILPRATRLRVYKHSNHQAYKRTDPGTVYPGLARTVPVLDGPNGPATPPAGYTWIQDASGDYWEVGQEQLAVALQPYDTPGKPSLQT